MIVTTARIAAPVALVEKEDRRILVLQEGLVPRPVVALLGRLLDHV